MSKFPTSLSMPGVHQKSLDINSLHQLQYVSPNPGAVETFGFVDNPDELGAPAAFVQPEHAYRDSAWKSSAGASYSVSIHFCI